MTVQELYVAKIIEDVKVRFLSIDQDGTVGGGISTSGTFGNPLDWATMEPLTYPEALKNAEIVKLIPVGMDIDIVIRDDDLEKVIKEIETA